MTDRETVVKWLTECAEKRCDASNCTKCPYKFYMFDEDTGTCLDRLMVDALALLKAQPRDVYCPNCGACVEVSGDD